MRKNKVTAAFLSLIILFSSVSVLAEEIKETEFSGEYNAFEQIAEYVAERYIDNTLVKEDIMKNGLSKLLENNDPLLIELLKSTLESMDDYSEFYTAEEYKEYIDKLNQTFYGIGITMKQAEGDYVEITGFAEENSMAERVGFKIGDKIYKVEGFDVTGLSMSEVRDKIIGKENTTVNITVLRGTQEINLTTTRIAINDQTVSAGVLKGDVGFMQISSFATNTSAEFAEGLEIMREKKIKNIILDLRNNPGGLVSDAVEIAQDIVPKGKIIDVKYRQSEYDATYNSDLKNQEFNFIVLVNENTASAAEILASAIQDSGCGKLLGTKTFGKAVIQNMFPLTNGMVFKITVGQYITRNGKEINHVGLEPDEYVENTIQKIDKSRYTPFDLSTKLSLGNTGDNVKAAKERLYMLGFYDGDVTNNTFDMDLKEAVKEFQRTNDLLAYGILDIPTQVKIDKMFSKLETTVDVQFETAYEMFDGDKETLYIK